MQYIFLNGRHIRDSALQHALAEAYRGLLMVGRYAIAFLTIDMPPDMVDVNVHPTKLEVRFQDGGRLYSQLLGTIRTRFLTTDLTHAGSAERAGVVTSGSAAGEAIYPCNRVRYVRGFLQRRHRAREVGCGDGAALQPGRLHRLEPEGRLDDGAGQPHSADCGRKKRCVFGSGAGDRFAVRENEFKGLQTVAKTAVVMVVLAMHVGRDRPARRPAVTDAAGLPQD